MVQKVNANDFLLQNIDTSISPRSGGYILLIKAAWCGHCVRYLPIFEELSKQHPDRQFLVLETTENMYIIKQWSNLLFPVYKVNSFPTVVIFGKDGLPTRVVNDRMTLDM